MQQCIIYIPGLGDHFDTFRKNSLKHWNAKTVFVPMNWDTEKAYQPKLRRIEKAIQESLKRKENICLIGESAGSTIALVAAAKHNLPIITICGVNNPKMHIYERTYVRAPAFRSAFKDMRIAFGSLNLLQVYTISPLVDRVVGPHDAKISGAVNRRLISFGHFFTISLCLTFLRGYVQRLIKN